MLYFIRTFATLSPEHFQAPRTPESVRRSLDGTLCVLAFDDGTAPEGWEDGMDAESMAIYLRDPEQVHIWSHSDL